MTDLVPGTCATREEFWYWLTGQHGITRPVYRHSMDRDYCLDGDDCGCLLMRHEGRCPYGEAEYARISEARREQAERSDVAIARGRR